MKYGTVCSGIEAPSAAWDSLGWEPVWFSEIDDFPSSVLNHYYPHVPNHGDMNNILKNGAEPVELICGGTPCQSFSVAGLRKGLDDPRGNLALVYLGIVEKLRPRWVIWENVPGVLSSNRGRDFGAFIGALGKLGYGWSYRVLDAQYFGVPQRRRRVFVVAHSSGDWRCAASVLFERESLSRYSAPGEKTGQETARGTGDGPYPTINAMSGQKWGSNQWINNGEWILTNAEGKKGMPSFTASSASKQFNNQQTLAISKTFTQNSRDEVRYIEGNVAGALSANEGMKQRTYLHEAELVRRLTPLEYERLQGFPDNYTLVPYKGKPSKDTPRYKALGNSMAVPVMKWLGERIIFFEKAVTNL